MKRIMQLIALILLLSHAAARAGETTSAPDLREEIWAIPSAVPMLAYMVRPIGEGPFPLLIMNHGVSLDSKERSYFPVIEFRDAALWFARQCYVVVAPVRPGYGATAIEIPERGLFGLFFSGVRGRLRAQASVIRKCEFNASGYLSKRIHVLSYSSVGLPSGAAPS